ncbi:hypothetical protein LBMAG49_04820 [Planctomycetota bacterium]|nr:hypothetical protein LBMAG49_04820 [Planctomycetota bacterium]
MTNIEQQGKKSLTPTAAYRLSHNSRNVGPPMQRATRPQARLEHTSRQPECAADCRSTNQTNAFFVCNLSNWRGGQQRKAAKAKKQSLRHNFGRLTALSGAQEQRQALRVR